MGRPAARLNDAALILAAVLLSVRAAFSALTLGDYPSDAGPSMTALLGGHLHAFGAAHPAMGDLSLFLRLPFAALAHLGAHPGELSVYRWGVLPCVLSVAALALWLASIARRRGMGGPLGSWAIVLLALLNPLLSSAIALGHPEELMTGSLCVASLVAACERRVILSAVLLGLALACKQWSVVVILPILLTLERERLRAFGGALLVAALATAPALLAAPAAFLRNQMFLAHDTARSTAALSWWWPLAPDTAVHVTIEGHGVSVFQHRLPLALVRSVHSLIIGVDVIVAVVAARLRRLPLSGDYAFALTAIVLLLRCTLDTETMPYYHAPLFLDLLAWDCFSAKRLPLRSLACAGVSYLLFDRFTPGAIGGTSSLLYAACTCVSVLLLVRTLLRGSGALSRSAYRHAPAVA